MTILIATSIALIFVLAVSPDALLFALSRPFLHAAVGKRGMRSRRWQSLQAVEVVIFIGIAAVMITVIPLTMVFIFVSTVLLPESWIAPSVVDGVAIAIGVFLVFIVGSAFVCLRLARALATRATVRCPACRTPVRVIDSPVHTTWTGDTSAYLRCACGFRKKLELLTRGYD